MKNLALPFLSWQSAPQLTFLSFLFVSKFSLLVSSCRELPPNKGSSVFHVSNATGSLMPKTSKSIVKMVKMCKFRFTNSRKHLKHAQILPRDACTASRTSFACASRECMLVTRVYYMAIFICHTFNLKYSADKTDVTVYFLDIFRYYVLYSDNTLQAVFHILFWLIMLIPLSNFWWYERYFLDDIMLRLIKLRKKWHEYAEGCFPWQDRARIFVLMLQPCC